MKTEDDIKHRSLPQQQGWSSYAPLRSQPTAQHGQPAQEVSLPLRVSRSFNPRPGH